MEVTLRQIHSPLWTDGWVLDKHSLRSVFVGEDPRGIPQFETQRTAVGEAMYQLKYKRVFSHASVLAAALAEHVIPKFPRLDLIVPMPATTARPRQPVVAVAFALGQRVRVPVAPTLLRKAKTTEPVKNLSSKQDKLRALGDGFSVHGRGGGRVLLVDDLYDTGATMEAACRALRRAPAILEIYVACLTCRLTGR